MRTNAKSGSGSDATSGIFSPRAINTKWPRQMDSLLKTILHTIPAGKRIVDVGAGAGNMVRRLREAGRECYGVDGIRGVEQLTDGLVRQADLTLPIQWMPPAEWAICIEVGEHIPAELEPAFLANLCSAATEGMVVTWATRAAANIGRGHCNCLDSHEVAARLWHYRWRVNRIWTREAVAMVRRPFRKKLLVLTRR